MIPIRSDGSNRAPLPVRAFLWRFLLLAAMFSLSCIAMFCFGLLSSLSGQLFLGIGCLAAVVAIALAIDAWPNRSAPRFSGGLWSLLHELLLVRKSLLAVIAIGFIVVAAASYYVITAIIAVEYSDDVSGLIFRLRGRSVYYVPLNPNVSWENTGITFHRGDTFSVDITGHVSPGLLQDINTLQKRLFTKIVSDNMLSDSAATILADSSEVDTRDLVWPFTGPEGYTDDTYDPTRYRVFARHGIYRTPRAYDRDSTLTVRGLPHNRIVAYIGNERPLTVMTDEPLGGRYVAHMDQLPPNLLMLSSKEYPVTRTAPCDGILWLVINDSELFRWDNAGMFFVKITKPS